MSLTRRTFIKGFAVLMAWLSMPARALAHHKPGHNGGPPSPSPSPSPTPPPPPPTEIGTAFTVGISALRDGSLLRAA